MAELLYRLGKLSARRTWIVLVSWLVILGVAVGGFLMGFKPLASSFDIPKTASGEVTEELEEKLPDFSGASGQVVFATTDGSALTDQQRDQISELTADAADLPDVSEGVDPFDSETERAEQMQELEDGREKLDDGQKQLDDGQEQLDKGQKQLDAGFDELDAAAEELDAAREQLEAAGQPTDQLDAQEAQLDVQREKLDAEQEKLDAEQEKLDDGQKDLDDNERQIEAGTELLEYAEGIRTVSSDESTAITNVAFTKPRLELEQETKDAVIDHFESEDIDGVDVSFSTDIAQGMPQIFGVGEGIGLAVAAVVLIVMLGSLLAASFPLITAVFGVGVGVLSSLSFSGVVDMNSVTPVLGVMLGLAVGIDYSLFIINRHRKQVLSGMDVRESIALANGTAGNAVVFAGTTVIIALAALNIVGIPFLGVMGTVAAACVAIAVLLSITATPALLGLAGKRLLTRKARARLDNGDRQTPPEMRPMPTWRALVTAVVSIAVLLTVAIPALSMRLGLPDGSTEPEGSAAYNAFMTVEDKFGAGANSPLLVTAKLPSGLDETELVETQLSVVEDIAQQESVSAVVPVATSDDDRLAAFQVLPEEGPNAVSTEDLVHQLRDVEVTKDNNVLGVAGQAAINIDISQNLNDVLPAYLALVVGLSLLIMIGVFRSLLVPLIATGGFVLSLLATYGAVVAVFQWGWLSDILAIHNTGPILSFLPVILVGILFGLAMDYQLFLSSGMREAYVHGSSARLAVAEGFRAGRSVVTAAGLIMVSVFGGFVFSDSMMIRSIGFGLAFGVLVDAFVVRMLLMPALMHLLGKSAWWLPRWLDRILPNVDVEGAALERRHGDA